MIDSAARLASTEEAPVLNGLRESDIRAELDRILKSRVFIHSHRIRRFLQFVVDECLLGRHHRLKEYLIGLEVFSRQETFDPRVDSIVRVEARRLRAKLEEYYATEGRDDEIRIELRKGSYVPIFEYRRPGAAGNGGIAPAQPLRRALAVGSITVSDHGENYDRVVEEIRRRLAHVLIKEGYFHVTAQAPALQTYVASSDGAGTAPIAAPDGRTADYVIDGNIQVRGNWIDVILQMYSVHDKSYVWSEEAECSIENVSAVDEMARSLNRWMATAGQADAARARRLGADRHAFDLYLQGRYQWKLGTPESVRSSVPLFTRAIEHDPNYAAAWAALAEALLVSAIFGYGGSPEIAVRMQDAARRAIALNNNLPEAHTGLGAVLSLIEWKWDEGERELQQAIHIASSDPVVHVAYGLQLACRRMYDQARSEMLCAQELDPASLIGNFAVGWFLCICGQYDESIAQHRTVSQIAPDFPLSYLGLGWAYAGKGLYQDAIAYFTNASSLLKSRSLLAGCLGFAYARAGQRDEALRHLAVLEAGEPPQDSPNWPVSAAAIHLGLGDRERALNCLERAVEAHVPSVPLRTLMPEFSELRGDARFERLLQAMGVA